MARRPDEYNDQLEPFRGTCKELHRLSHDGVLNADIRNYPILAQLAGIEHDLTAASSEDLKKFKEFNMDHIEHFDDDDDLREHVALCFGAEEGFRGKGIGVRVQKLADRLGKSFRTADRRRRKIITKMAQRMHG